MRGRRQARAAEAHGSHKADRAGGPEGGTAKLGIVLDVSAGIAPKPWSPRTGPSGAWTLTLLLIGLTINYIDRQTLSVLAPTLQQEFSLTTAQYAAIINSFLGVYCIMYAVAGRVIDRLGTRRGLALAVIWWSCAEILHVAATGFASLCIARALLAVGEAAMIPSAVKAVAESFSIEKRSLALSIVEVGLSLGPIIAPPLVAWMALQYGWRYAFVCTGGAGLLWAVPWWLVYRDPQAVNAGTMMDSPAASQKLSWFRLFRSPEVLAVGCARCLGDPVWYFYLFWLPKYLTDSRGLDLASVGTLAWIPYVASLAGGLAGGGASGWLVPRGFTPAAARLRVMLVSACLVSSGVLAIYVDSIAWALLFISIASFAMLAWGINVDTLPTDLFVSAQVARVTGIAGFFGAGGSILFTALTGWAVERFSYRPIWIASAVMYPAAFVIASALLRRRVSQP
jgi:MFS transporter, ACS family, hexuronate transporter